jgi:hypothetical protein
MDVKESHGNIVLRRLVVQSDHLHGAESRRRMMVEHPIQLKSSWARRERLVNIEMKVLSLIQVRTHLLRLNEF